MENVVSRHRNLVILAAVLFAQVIGLAIQVKRPTDHGSTALIRLWAVRIINPGQEAIVHSTSWAREVWRNYLYLRGVRQENRQLREELHQLRMERVRMAEDASQARRLQALLGFKEQLVSQSLPAQVISTTGTDFSRGIYIDKGSNDGLRPDMPVMTPEGVIGKVIRVYPSSSLVLLIHDPSSGAGVILEKSRLQGILRGTPSGETELTNIMLDEQVDVGERVLTSGGDRVFPIGLPVGMVTQVTPGDDLFLRIRVKPSARLDRLEEVLVITKVEEQAPSVDDLNGPVRAVDVLSQRLPSVPESPAPAGGAPGTNLPAPTRHLPPVASVAPPPSTTAGAGGTQPPRSAVRSTAPGSPEAPSASGNSPAAQSVPVAQSKPAAPPAAPLEPVSVETPAPPAVPANPETTEDTAR